MFLVGKFEQKGHWNGQQQNWLTQSSHQHGALDDVRNFGIRPETINALLTLDKLNNKGLAIRGIY